MSKSETERKLEDLRKEVAQLEELVALEKRVRELRDQVGAAPTIQIIPQVPYIPLPYPVYPQPWIVTPWVAPSATSRPNPPYTITCGDSAGNLSSKFESTCTILSATDGGVYTHSQQ